MKQESSKIKSCTNLFLQRICDFISFYESNVLRMPPKKQYGLILKKKDKKAPLQPSKLSFFDDDDDEMDEKKTIETEIKQSAAKKKMQKQTQVCKSHVFFEK